MTDGRDQLAFALDVATLAEAKRMISLLAPEVGVFKVGLELFTAVGPAAIDAVHEAGRECFLDLKLHDIAATVARSVKAATQLGVAYLTLHAVAGGSALQQAAESVVGSRTRLLAITVLTSLNDRDLDAVGLAGPAEAAVMRLASLASASGIGGVVCSALEVPKLRAALGPAAFLVTPGIRETDAAKGDQQRTQGPAEAISAGSNLLVVGRPIRDAADPLAAAHRYRMAIATAKRS